MAASTGTVLSKEKALSTYKIQQEIQMKNMEVMMKDPAMMSGMQSPEG